MDESYQRKLEQQKTSSKLMKAAESSEEKPVNKLEVEVKPKILYFRKEYGESGS